VRPPVEDIAAPEFPRKLPWVNAATLRMSQQLGRPVLVEFWDFCRVNSLCTLPYLKAWHERYEPHGLRVVGVHAAGFVPSAAEEEVRAAVQRLGIAYPVAIDSEYEIWHDYGNEGWPARYLWNANGHLVEYHYGEGDYAGTEEAIQEQLGLAGEPLTPALRPEDEPGAVLEPQTEDQPGPYSGPYEAGGVWAVLEGEGSVRANGREIRVTHPGAYPLLEHPRHTRGELELEPGAGVRCHAVCFAPGLR